MTIKRIFLDEVDLVINLFDQYRVFYKKESDLELARKFLTERLSNNESVIYVAMDGNIPAVLRNYTQNIHRPVRCVTGF